MRMRTRESRRGAKTQAGVNYKNLIFCTAARRQKLQFATEGKANAFLNHLSEDDFTSGTVPIRSYYCDACCVHHVTSKAKQSRQQFSALAY